MSADYEPTCYCGHVLDEHERNKRSAPAECGVKGCDCILYDQDDEYHGDEDDSETASGEPPR